MHVSLATDSMEDQWEAIRDLDEKENWIERTAVLSRDDHLQLLQCAKVCGGVCSIVSIANHCLLTHRRSLLMLWTIYPCESKPLSVQWLWVRLSNESILVSLFRVSDEGQTDDFVEQFTDEDFQYSGTFHKAPTRWNVRKHMIVFYLQLLSLMWTI